MLTIVKVDRLLAPSLALQASSNLATVNDAEGGLLLLLLEVLLAPP